MHFRDAFDPRCSADVFAEYDHYLERGLVVPLDIMVLVDVHGGLLEPEDVEPAYLDCYQEISG